MSVIIIIAALLPQAINAQDFEDSPFGFITFQVESTAFHWAEPMKRTSLSVQGIISVSFSQETDIRRADK